MSGTKGTKKLSMFKFLSTLGFFGSKPYGTYLFSHFFSIYYVYFLSVTIGLLTLQWSPLFK